MINFSKPYSGILTGKAIMKLKKGEKHLYYLSEFRRRPKKLTDLLPWLALIAPGVVLNKDGSFQKSYRFRGKDLASSTREELINSVARLNNVFKRLETGWVINIEARRVLSKDYPKSQFTNPVARLIDEERKAFFEAGQHYESLYYLTLTYIPPSDILSKWEKYLIDRDYQKEETNMQTHLKNFLGQAQSFFNIFRECMYECQELTDAETLTYLHSTISTKEQKIKVPECPMYLDSYISDTPLTTGLEPKLGDRYLKIISVKQFPAISMPGLLDKLNQLEFEYRFSTRFICLDKQDALKEIDEYQRKHAAKSKNLVTKIIESVTKKELPPDNPEALVKMEEAMDAKAEIQGDLINYGYYTMAIVVWDADPNQVAKKAEQVEKILNSLGLVTINEQLNAVEAWLGSLPGLFRANIRRPLIHTVNLAHLIPISAIWAGAETNQHLQAESLIYTQTTGNTPFRLNLHIGDVGHTMVIGPTGSGKSVLLALLAAQFLRYQNAQVYFFDKDGSCRTLAAGVGGDFYDLSVETEINLAFQPLARIDEAGEKAFASEWLLDYLDESGMELNSENKSLIWEALTSLANSPKEERTISGLTFLIQDKELKKALEPLTLSGAFGNLFDSNTENLEYGSFQVFEMAKLMNTPAAIAPALSYIFHRLEERFTGVPSLLILDESWIFLKNPVFAAKIEEWLKVLRKKNVAVVFASQSLTDVTNSSIASSIIESCLNKIYLPNATAMEQTTKPLYEAFGLNNTEIKLISEALPKLEYYYKSTLGSRLFELALEEIALAYCGASSAIDQKMVKKFLKEYGRDEFNRAWLEYKGLPEALQQYQEFIKATVITAKESIKKTMKGGVA